MTASAAGAEARGIRLERRAATEADVPFLIQLRRATMDVHLLASGAPVTTEAHHARLMRHFDCAQVLLKNGYPVGLLKLQRQPLEWEILQIQLAPELQGSGIGRRIIEDVLIDATAQSAAVRLGVLKANPARRLYERLGFEVIGEDDQEFLMLHRAPGQPSP